MKKILTKLVFIGVLCAAVWQLEPTKQVQAEEQAVTQGEDIPLDEAHFPCKEFREQIAESYDRDSNGILSRREIEEVQQLSIETWFNETPYSLEGIEYFTNLELIEYKGMIPEKGTLKKNQNLKKVYYTESFSSPECDWKKVEDVFFSENLEEFHIIAINNLKSINISTLMKNLKVLEMQHCAKLTKVNVAKAPNLQKISIRNTPIKKLDLTKNTKMEEVQILFGDWYNCYRSSSKNIKYKIQFFKNAKYDCKIKFASKNNIKKLEYFAKRKELDITQLKKLKTISVPQSMKVKTTKKWYQKNKKTLKFFGDGEIQKKLKKYTQKQMIKLQAVKDKNGKYVSNYYDDVTHG